MADNANTETTTAPAYDEYLTAAWDRPGLNDLERIQARWNGTTWHETGPGPHERAHEAMLAASAGKITYADFERILLTEKCRDSELRAIRAERPTAPAVHGSTHDMGQPIVEAALARSAGLSDPEKHFTPEVLEASDRAFRGGLGLQETLLQAASANGYTGRTRITSGNLREVLGYACPVSPIRASGFSTLDVSGILSNLSNKMIRDGFAAVESAWREISTIKPLNDFKTATRYRLLNSGDYEELPPAGEIAHGALSEESYTIRAKTYARMYALTRTDIVNDDLGAFDQMRQILGRGAGLKINNIFWTEFLDNATFYTAARGNYTQGADTALSLASLAAVEVLFSDLTDASGNPLGNDAAILLTPKALSPLARQLYVSLEIRDTTSSTRSPIANIFQNRYKPVASSYLANSSYSGYSSLAWYLLGDPKILPTMEVGFLNGQESPTIESADADFNTLGVQLRGYHDFGCSKAEYRAGVKALGEAE